MTNYEWRKASLRRSESYAGHSRRYLLLPSFSLRPLGYGPTKGLSVPRWRKTKNE